MNPLFNELPPELAAQLHAKYYGDPTPPATPPPVAPPPPGPRPGDPGFDVTSLGGPAPAHKASGIVLPDGVGEQLVANSQATQAAVRQQVAQNEAAPPGAPAPAQASPAPDAQVASSPGTFVPGHMEPKGTETTLKFKSFDPAAQESAEVLRQSSTGNALLAADKQHEAEQQQIATELRVAHEKARQSAMLDGAKAKLAEEKSLYVNTENARLEQMNRDLMGDPTDAYWKERGTLQHVLTAIGIGLSTLGGTGDQAMKMLQNNLANFMRGKENAYARTKSLYQENVERFDNKAKALAATEAAYWQRVELAAEQERAESKGKMSDAQYMGFVSKIQEKAAEAQEKFRDATAIEHDEKQSEKYVPGQMVGGSGDSGTTKATENVITLTDGTQVQLPSDQNAEKVREQIQQKQIVRAVNKRAGEVLNELDRLGPVADRSRWNALKEELDELAIKKVNALSLGEGQGQVKQEEMKQALESRVHWGKGYSTFESIGNVGAYAQSNRKSARDALKAQDELMEREIRSLAAGAGGRIVKTGYGKDEHGNLTPTGKYTGQDLKPDTARAPSDFSAVDPRATVFKQGPTVGESTKNAPVFPGVVKTEHHGGRKKKADE